MDEHFALPGGLANAGRVHRHGRHVVRPSSPHTASIHTFLRTVRRSGFEGAPMPVGIDPGGWERLEFLPGDVPTPPYPDWSQSAAALASIARLVRALHDASVDFDARNHCWAGDLADPAGGPVMCHNDIELSNVVFRDGRAVALIDFEFAAPGRRVYDLAHLARLCVPLDHPTDRARLGWQPADRPTRLRLLADAYGLDGRSRRELLPAVDDALDRIEEAMRRQVASGDPAALEIAERTGGFEKYDRRRRWWRQHRAAFARALRGDEP